MLTQERADMITGYLGEDEIRAEEIFSLELEEALEKMNADGNDFTLEELKEYEKALEAMTADGELDADELDNVAGGLVTTVAAAIGIGVVVAIFGKKKVKR